MHTSNSADDTKARVEKEGRQCLLIEANLENDADCKKIVEDHVGKFGQYVNGALGKPHGTS